MEGEKKTIIPAHCRVSTIEKARRAAYWTGNTMVSVIDRAILAYVKRLERSRGGKEFEAIPAGDRLKTGPRVK